MKKSKITNIDNKISVDLYHGTSTLFLDSIIENGLGGINPVTEWNLIELCKEVYKLSEEYLEDTQVFQISGFALKLMSEQSNNGSFNYQHGETYLSASKLTSCRYAIDKEYGSEMLSYIIKFLKELINKEIPYVTDELYHIYPKVYHLKDCNPSPMLVQVRNVDGSNLKNEHDGDPMNYLQSIINNLNLSEKNFDEYTQPYNFRLKRKIELKNLKFYLINVQHWDNYFPKYNFYEIHPEGKTSLRKNISNSKRGLV